MRAWLRSVQGGDTTSEDDEGYVTDPEPEPPTSAALGGGTESGIPDVLPNAAAAGGGDGEPTPESVEEFRQRLARKESGAEAGTSGRPATAFGLEARHTLQASVVLLSCRAGKINLLSKIRLPVSPAHDKQDMVTHW